MVKIPYYRQKKHHFCGPAVLQMIFKYFGKRVSQEQLSRLLGTSERYGTNRKSLKSVVKVAGLLPFAKSKGNLEDVKKFLSLRMPVIVNFVEPKDEEGHYAIVVDVTGEKIILNDPWNGKETPIKLNDFDRRWKARNKWLMVVSSKLNKGL